MGITNERKEKYKEFYQESEKSKKTYQKEYYEKNKQLRKEYAKEYRQTPERKEKSKEYSSEWKKKNPLRRTYHANLYKISGYTYDEFETHLLNLGWKPKLHIDHKIPVTHFSPDTPIRLINDLRNLQVLTLQENTTKNNTYRDIVDKEYYEEVKRFLVL